MKSSVLSLLAPAAMVAAQPWYNGAPECATSCLSSVWSSTTAWPSPGSFCTATDAPIATCLSSACSGSTDAYASFTSHSASLCSQWSSCSGSGSTGVYTITATGPWGPGGTWGPGHGGPGGWGPHGSWTGSYSSGGTYTVTGCPWDGSPWFGGPGAGFGGWGGWGSGWKWSTHTSDVTATITTGGSVVVSTGAATIGEAVSGDTTSTTTFGVGAAQQTSAPGSGASANGVKVMGAALGGVVAVVVGVL